MDPSSDRPADGHDDDAEVIWLFDPEAAPAPGPVPCRPGELFARLAATVARAGLHTVAVTGVVSGLKRRGRWASFDLAEHADGAETASAVVRVVLFAKVLRRVDATLDAEGRALEDGVAATVVGEVDFHAAWGSVRVVGSEVEVHEGRSEVMARRDALVAELEASGALRAQAALVVPGRPLRIGVVAGEGTAGAADVDAVLDGSGLEWQVLRRSVPMAGPAAPEAVAGAVTALARQRPDVIVVARGGGARGELACFDTEVVARAIAGCGVPVWAAIGHASDDTVADRVANRSCPTPPAAAFDLVERVHDFERRRNERLVLADHRRRVAAVEARARRVWLVAMVAVAALVALVLAAVG